MAYLIYPISSLFLFHLSGSFSVEFMREISERLFLRLSSAEFVDVYDLKLLSENYSLHFLLTVTFGTYPRFSLKGISEPLGRSPGPRPVSRRYLSDAYLSRWSTRFLSSSAYPFAEIRSLCFPSTARLPGLKLLKKSSLLMCALPLATCLQKTGSETGS